MTVVGYEKLRQQFGLATFDIERPAKVMPRSGALQRRGTEVQRA